MAYTKQQLLDAFCESQGYNAEKDGTKLEFLTSWEDKRQVIYDRRLAFLKTPREQAKEVALDYLLAQVKAENADVSL